MFSTRKGAASQTRDRASEHNDCILLERDLQTCRESPSKKTKSYKHVKRAPQTCGQSPTNLWKEIHQCVKRHLRIAREGAASQTRRQASEHNDWVRVKRYLHARAKSPTKMCKSSHTSNRALHTCEKALQTCQKGPTNMYKSSRTCNRALHTCD